MSKPLTAAAMSSDPITATPSWKNTVALEGISQYSMNGAVSITYLWLSVATSATMVQIKATATVGPPRTIRNKDDSQIIRRENMFENQHTAKVQQPKDMSPGMLRLSINLRHLSASAPYGTARRMPAQ